jgi:beta-galactosidase
LEGGGDFQCSQWCDVLSPVTSQTLASYSSEYFAGRAAVTKNVRGAGTVYYIGTILDDAANRALLGRIARELAIDSIPDLPEGMETAVRSSATTRLRFILNLTKESKRITLDTGRWKSTLFSEPPLGDSIEFAPGAVEVFVDTRMEAATAS